MAQLGTVDDDDIIANEPEVYGLEGNDSIQGSVDRRYDFYGGSGSYILRLYGDAYGYLFGGIGRDTLSGGSLGDYLSGDTGDDLLVGGEYDSALFNNNGQIAIFQNRSTGDDYLDGGIDRDAIYAFDGNDVLYGGSGDESGSITVLDQFRVPHEVAAGLFGGAGNDFLDGDDGNDTLNGGIGADRLTGGDGNDLLYVDNSADQVIESAGAGTGTDRVLTAINYTLAAGQNIELFTTTSAAGTGAINLTGNEIAQTLIGNAGANFLNGLGGPDTLTGLGGNDFFSFTTPRGTNNIDHVTDFSVPADTIRLAKAIFSVLNVGTLAASAYKEIGDPGDVVDADDRILYNDDTGALYYDTNGSGAAGRLHFATLDNRPATLTYADFVVVA